MEGNNENTGWSVFLPKEQKSIRLDKRDLLLLDALRENSRLSLNVLNKITKLSKSSILNRINNLEKEGIIKGYFTLVNIHNLGYRMTSISIKTKMTLIEKEKYIQYLKKIPYLNQIITFASTEWDFLVRIYSKDTKHFNDIIEAVTDFPGVLDIEFFPLEYWQINLKKHFFTDFNLNSFIKKEDSSFYKSFQKKKTKKVEVDEKDLALIYHLSKNSRFQLITLAEKIDLSPDAISYRIKKLIQKGIIESFIAVPDLYFFGFIPYLFNIQIYKRNKTQRIIDFIINNISSTGVLVSRNSWNIQAFVFVKNPKELKEFEEALIHKFSNEIHNYKILQLKEQPYFDFFPKEFLSTIKEEKP